MAIKIEDHIKEIDGIKYVPLDVVNKYYSEVYGNQMDEINSMMTKAFSTYNESLKDILDDKNSS